MIFADPASENMRFLLAEINGQFALLIAYFKAPSRETALALEQRAGYSHNLSARVRKYCLSRTRRGRGQEAAQALDQIASRLDLMSRLARRAVEHAERIAHPKLLRAGAYHGPLEMVRDRLAQVTIAFWEQDSRSAVNIGKGHAALTAFRDQLFRSYAQDFARTKHVEDVAHSLLVLQEIFLMGEALQAISEAILSHNIGQPIQLERYTTLRRMIATTDPAQDIQMQPLAETRSGSDISSVNLHTRKGRAIAAVFKEGERRKVRDERAGVKSWNTVYPGLAPQIFSYQKRGDSAALLIEHLSGETFEALVLGGSDAELAAAQKALHKTVRNVWRKTRIDAPARMKAMAQLRKRLGDIHRVHPGLVRGPETLGSLTCDSFEKLIDAAEAREASLSAPFSVYIHGDFNLDNVIYEPGTQKIRYIDLHRSRYMDYAQDVSVFMVSNYRLQVLDAPTRARIQQVALDMFDTALRFAQRNKDQTFQYRLALGLARSFASSTRFVLDPDHAKRMMMRAHYLLETALRVRQGKEAHFSLPIRMLLRD